MPMSPYQKYKNQIQSLNKDIEKITDDLIDEAKKCGKKPTEQFLALRRRLDSKRRLRNEIENAYYLLGRKLINEMKGKLL